jgi:hypothetical protein
MAGSRQILRVEVRGLSRPDLGAGILELLLRSLGHSSLLFARGADYLAAMVFMPASTNLVVELGLVLAILIRWQFVAAEIVGGRS